MELITFRKAGQRFRAAGLAAEQIADLRRSGRLQAYHVVGIPTDFLDAAEVEKERATLTKKGDLNGLLTIYEVSDKLNLSASQLDRLIKRGKLKLTHRGRLNRRYVNESELASIKPGKCDPRKVEQYAPDELVTAAAAARLLGIPRPAVRKAVSMGLIAHTRHGPQYLVRIDDLLTWHQTQAG